MNDRPKILFVPVSGPGGEDPQAARGVPGVVGLELDHPLRTEAKAAPDPRDGVRPGHDADLLAGIHGPAAEEDERRTRQLQLVPVDEPDDPRIRGVDVKAVERDLASRARSDGPAVKADRLFRREGPEGRDDPKWPISGSVESVDWED